MKQFTEQPVVNNHEIGIAEATQFLQELTKIHQEFRFNGRGDKNLPFLFDLRRDKNNEILLAIQKEFKRIFSEHQTVIYWGEPFTIGKIEEWKISEFHFDIKRNELRLAREVKEIFDKRYLSRLGVTGMNNTLIMSLNDPNFRKGTGEYREEKSRNSLTVFTDFISKLRPQR